ncbi:MAG TPA: hypothetical protein VG944_07070 [Fimbriimonas sp.]|nr:hypothetical protein [Fimbriimonas sp.]
MFDLWNEELTEEQEEELLDRAANTIERRKLTTPAIMFLEMHKPLAFIGANAAVAFSPFLVPVLGFDTVNDYSRLLKKPQNVERLLQRLERKPAEVTG